MFINFQNSESSLSPNLIQSSRQPIQLSVLCLWSLNLESFEVDLSIWKIETIKNKGKAAKKLYSSLLVTKQVIFHIFLNFR